MDKRINVLIIEDEKEIMEGYAFLINQYPDFSAKGFTSSEDALEYMKSNKPDLILMDVNLPGTDGITCTRIIKKMYPEVLIMMFTIYENNENVFKALEAGASGYLLKQSPPEELIEALHELHNGGAPMSSSIARMVVASFNKNKAEKNEYELTEREREVLILLSEGYRYKDIAAKLFVSISTIRSHIYNIYEKLHVHNRTEALIKFNKRN
ncbi:MAG: Response regulator UvrY [Bacteroidetes bacterium ADurb.Bin397]|jgi:DNA-binding NarL/FixJ family response regulator|nr:MAG: Response regulator UvrY [Bacteroidetes bacterium ADurb.Bin397]